MPVGLPRARALILTCQTAVLLLLLPLVVRDEPGGVQRVWGQGLGLEGGGGPLRRGRRSGGRRGRGWELVAPRKRGSAQTRLLRLQQPALGLCVLSAPLGFQAAVIPFFLSPLHVEQTKAQRSESGGAFRVHERAHLPSAPRLHTDHESRGQQSFNVTVYDRNGQIRLETVWRLPGTFVLSWGFWHETAPKHRTSAL